MEDERISHENSLWIIYRMLAEDYFDIMGDSDVGANDSFAKKLKKNVENVINGTSTYRKRY